MNASGRVTRLLSFLICAAAWSAAAPAQEYPSRMITIVVPYTAGGPTDMVARMIAPKLAEKLGQNVIVENVTGGGTNIGIGRVVNAPPDGYTLLVHNIQVSINVGLYPKLPFDIEKQLVPIGFINNNAIVLIGRKDLPVNSLGELVAWLKKSPAKIANAGIGSSAHLCSLLLSQAIAAPINPIAYRGATPMLQDVIGGHVDLSFGTPQHYIEPIKAGLVKGLAVSTRERLPQIPNVESMATVIDPKLEVIFWHAMFAPAGTPKAVVDRLNAVLREAIDDPDIRKAWANTSMKAYPQSQQTVDAAKVLMRDEVARWTAIIRANKLELAN